MHKPLNHGSYPESIWPVPPGPRLANLQDPIQYLGQQISPCHRPWARSAGGPCSCHLIWLEFSFPYSTIPPIHRAYPQGCNPLSPPQTQHLSCFIRRCYIKVQLPCYANRPGYQLAITFRQLSPSIVDVILHTHTDISPKDHGHSS